jgi:hypothetical protein
MFKKAAMAGLLAGALAATISAQEGKVPKGVRHLDHVFVIMMENHGYNQIVNNPSAPFINHFAKSGNTAKNYFAIAHPSLTNYLEMAGGSNFGVLNDNSPDWHNVTCTTNLASGSPSLDNGTAPAICPIDGVGTDAATPAFDFSNETSGPPGDINIDGTHSIPAAKNIVGKTIADQLAAAGLRWKSYQESLPPQGADKVNNSDGFYDDTTGFAWALPGETQSLIKLYAVKHNPFAYFRSVQEGTDAGLSLKDVQGFQGAHGLFDDLESGHVPAFSFIAPNQCNDQHARGNAGPACDFDPHNNGTQNGLNPALIYLGDLAVQTLVKAIQASPAWHEGNNAIVLLWDENDYTTAPITNQVLLTVDTNYGSHGKESAQFYTHFSLLKSLEAGFGLPCLNHACDSSVKVMSDLFGGGDEEHEQE